MDEQDDNIVYLPSAGRESPSPEQAGTAQTPPTEQPDVLEGELVPEDEAEEIDRRLAGQKMLALREASATRTVVVVHRIRESDKPVTALKGALRQVLYVLAGGWVLGKRVWESRTNSRYERLMRVAEVTGDYDKLADWEQRAEQARERRHRRKMDWIRAPFDLLKAMAVLVLAVVLVLLGLGLLIGTATKDASRILDPFTAALDFVRWVIVAVTVAWGPFVLVAPWLAMLGLWHVGRAQGNLSWVPRLQPAHTEDSSFVSGEGIARALQHLNIGPLNKAFKEGWQLEFELTPVKEGQGYHAVFAVPLGVSPSMIADKRELLAKNLHRLPIEVWITDAGKSESGRSGDIDLYVANSGVLAKPAPEYPLLHTGKADVFAGVPVGVTQRGNEIAMPLADSNFVFGGMMGQGKSNGCRVTVLGAALDPLAEIWVHVFAGNGDFDAFKPRLARYERGADDAVAMAGMQSLQDLAVEVARREARLAELGAKKLTRQIAEKHPDLRPLVSLYSECHELFSSEYGKDAADAAITTIKRGRKTGVVLGFDTQSSRKDAIPPAIVELVRINCCFHVKSWRSNDGFLGDGSFQAGIRATELRPDKDRGTCVVTGIGSEAFELVKNYFIPVDDDTGWDAATDVIARAMKQLAPHTVIASPTAPKAIEATEEHELLECLDEVLDDTPAPAARVAKLLQHHAPHWKPYQGLTRDRLVQMLARLDFKVPTTGNTYPIDPLKVRQRLAELATADLDEDGE